MIPTTNGFRTPSEIINDLVYLNYAHNRRLSPGISPERWRKVYGPPVEEMEARFQAELDSKNSSQG